jgi:hypothetical protein
LVFLDIPRTKIDDWSTPSIPWFPSPETPIKNCLGFIIAEEFKRIKREPSVPDLRGRGIDP